jgi:hypothetical protein
MGDDMVYIRPPDWWPEPVPEGHVLLLLKSIYGTRQAERKWHEHISSWMERNGYAAVNSDMTIFMKRSGSEYIIHGLFVDDMMHIYSCDAIKDVFMQLYSKDFEITGGLQMKTFLGMQVEQTARREEHDQSRFISIITSRSSWLAMQNTLGKHFDPRKSR